MVEISNIGQDDKHCPYIQLLFLLKIHVMKSPFLTMIAEQMYLKRYAKSTVKAYLYWIASFIRFNSMRHPTTM
jgi:hypothetical protein